MRVALTGWAVLAYCYKTGSTFGGAVAWDTLIFGGNKVNDTHFNARKPGRRAGTKKHSPWVANFARNLRAFREKSGITQDQLAEMSGKVPTTICKIERGDFSVGLDQIHDICAAIGVSPLVMLSPKPDETEVRISGVVHRWPT